MMLQENQICQYKQNCPYNKDFACYGGTEHREHTFTCDYVDGGGNFVKEAPQRNPLDKTGKMQVVME